MKAVLIICLFILALPAAAQKASLSQSVNHAKTQGKVLSAKTKNGKHVVKVLTPEGKIKTITRPAIEHSAANKKDKAYKNKANKQGSKKFKPKSSKPTKFDKKTRNQSRQNNNNRVNRQVNKNRTQSIGRRLNSNRNKSNKER